MLTKFDRSAGPSCEAPDSPSLKRGPTCSTSGCSWITKATVVSLALSNVLMGVSLWQQPKREWVASKTRPIPPTPSMHGAKPEAGPYSTVPRINCVPAESTFCSQKWAVAPRPGYLAMCMVYRNEQSKELDEWIN